MRLTACLPVCLVLLSAVALPATARLPPKQRAIVARVPMPVADGRAPFATLHAGQPVEVLTTSGTKWRVRTLGAAQVTGVVPKRQLGICTAEQAPARLTRGADPVGFVPRGWCFRFIEEKGEEVRLVDGKWGLTFWVETRYLTAQVDWKKRMDPAIEGFVAYRLRAQPMRTAPAETPYFTVPAAEHLARTVHEEGEFALIEVVGEVVVLQGWEQVTNLYQDLFRTKDDIERARRALLARRPAGKDPRPWFKLKRTVKVHHAPARQLAGQLTAGSQVTIGRRSGRWAQVRLETKDRRGKPLYRLEAQLWVPADALDPIRSAFD